MSRKLSRKRNYLGPLALVLTLGATGVGLAVESARHDAPVAKSQQEVAPDSVASLRKVEDVKKVCMITNRVFDKDQIPVEVEGKTYYGCCPACKETLTNDASSRSAVDPVSGKTVDKASAVIGVQPDGSVLYFENEASLQQYASRS
jgi:YHS domain-containing protein